MKRKEMTPESRATLLSEVFEMDCFDSAFNLSVADRFFSVIGQYTVTEFLSGL